MVTTELETFTPDEIAQIETDLAEGVVPERIAHRFNLTRGGFLNRLDNTGFDVEIVRRLRPNGRNSGQARYRRGKAVPSPSQVVAEFPA